MAKNKIKPDTMLKVYWNRSKEFADLFNALLYGGEPVIKAEDLREKDTESSVVLQVDSGVESKQAARDVFKVVMATENAEYMLLGIENQEGIHYAMPLRDLEYNTYSYQKQYEKIKEKYPKKRGLTGNEFLSHMKKTDKFIPVITAVIYYGDEPWDGAKSLYEMLNLSEELKPFVSDHKMNLIEVRNTKLIFHNKNNKDLFHLFQLAYDREKSKNEKKEEAIAYAEENKIDNSVLLAFGATSGIQIETAKREGKSMCTFFEELRQDGKAIGIIEMGLEVGWEEEKILQKLQTTLEISAEQAQEYFKEYGK